MQSITKIFIITLCFSWLNVFAVTKWQILSPGLAYAKITINHSNQHGYIHAFKINLSKYKLKLVSAKDIQSIFPTVKRFVMDSHALLGINGGFFTPTLTPLGLRIKNGEVTHKLKKISWWGIFYIKNNRPYIVSQKYFRKQKNIEFAIQSGPRLIVNGYIPSLKSGVDNRSALGITRNGEVIIAATNNLAITTTQLAKIMRNSYQADGLNCRYALNLDGGTSTQLYASIGDFQLYLMGFSPVADAIVVVANK